MSLLEKIMAIFKVSSKKEEEEVLKKTGLLKEEDVKITPALELKPPSPEVDAWIERMLKFEHSRYLSITRPEEVRIGTSISEGVSGIGKTGGISSTGTYAHGGLIPGIKLEPYEKQGWGRLTKRQRQTKGFDKYVEIDEEINRPKLSYTEALQQLFD